MAIQSRYFIVGCPRSGTTLLQSLLASHSAIYSFPESHFFCNLFGDYEPKRRMLGIASRRIRPRIKDFLEELGQKKTQNYLPPKTLLFVDQYTNFFIQLLDRLTIENQRTIWLEKTPPHLHYIDYIEKKVANANFIHIIRNGPDVVASIYDLRNRYPDIWDGRNNQISNCVDRWVNDLQITLKHIEKPNHTIVTYERLIADTEYVLEQLCQRMRLSFEPDMLTNYAGQAKRVSLGRETWKKSVGDKIQNRQNEKFKRILTSDQQNYVLERLSGWTVDKRLFPCGLV